MEFKTVTLTDLKKNPNELFSEVVRGAPPLRVLHRGHGIKVVITFDHYLDLVAYWNSGMPSQMVPKSEEIEKDVSFKQKLAELMAMAAKEEDGS